MTSKLNTDHITRLQEKTSSLSESSRVLYVLQVLTFQETQE